MVPIYKLNIKNNIQDCLSNPDDQKIVGDVENIMIGNVDIPYIKTDMNINDIQDCKTNPTNNILLLDREINSINNTVRNIYIPNKDSKIYNIQLGNNQVPNMNTVHIQDCIYNPKDHIHDPKYTMNTKNNLIQDYKNNPKNHNDDSKCVYLDTSGNIYIPYICKYINIQDPCTDPSIVQDRSEDPMKEKGCSIQPDVMNIHNIDKIVAMKGSEQIHTEPEPSPGNARFIKSFLGKRGAVFRSIRNKIAEAVDLQKESADRSGRNNTTRFKKNDNVLLSTLNLPKQALTNLGSNKLLPRFIGPFRIQEIISDGVYRLDIPSRMKIHPVFNIDKLKAYQDPLENPLTPSEPSQDREYDHAKPIRVARSRSKTSRDNYISHEGCRVHRQPYRPRYHIDPESRPLRSPPPPIIDSEGQNRFLVESIDSHRKQGGKMYYLVRWKGYPPSQSSWEPHFQLEMDIPDVLKDYLERQGLSYRPPS